VYLCTYFRCSMRSFYFKYIHINSPSLLKLQKDFETEVCVGKQKIRSNKTRSTSALLHLPFRCVPNADLAQITALQGRWQLLSSFSFMSNEESQKGVCLQNSCIRNPCFLFLCKHYRGGKSVRAHYKDRILRKDLERYLKGKMSLTFSWL